MVSEGLMESFSLEIDIKCPTVRGHKYSMLIFSTLKSRFRILPPPGMRLILTVFSPLHATRISGSPRTLKNGGVLSGEKDIPVEAMLAWVLSGTVAPQSFLNVITDLLPSGDGIEVKRTM
jgi:hypothetical protein